MRNLTGQLSVATPGACYVGQFHGLAVSHRKGTMGTALTELSTWDVQIRAPRVEGS